jgi:glycosyltransferase involved in cell wall biosynthesis
MNSGPSNIIFWSRMLLTPSETFIRAQAVALRRFTPHFAGVRYVGAKSLLSPEQCLLVNNGGIGGAIRETAFKVTGKAPAMRRKLAALRPALIHAHHGVNAALALPLAKAMGLPLVVTFYGRDATVNTRAQLVSPTQWVFMKRARELKRDATLFIAVSAFIKRKLIERGYPADRIVAHYYGVDTRIFRPDPSVQREPIVLFVGRLAEKKGIEYLIRAMESVQSNYPEMRLVIIGDGPLGPALRAQAARSLRRCEFLGLQPADVVRQWMNRSSIFVAPSVTAASGDSEGLPTVVVEAQAMGLPVVASDHAGISEAIVDGQTGLLAPERDVAMLTAHILRLCADPSLRSALADSARRDVELKFDIRNQTAALEDMYADILRDRRPAPSPELVYQT